jgi:type I restriction enzyme S subunit
MPRPLRFIEIHTIGQAVKGINLRDLRRALIAAPPLPEQRRIAAALDAHDGRLRAERAQLDKLRQIKKSLMHDLLTGKVRVQVPQEAMA